MAILYYFFSHCLFWLTVSSLFIMTLSQLFGRYIWQLELFSHYVPHLAVLTILATVIYPKFDVSSKIACKIRGLFLVLGLILIVWSLQPLSLLSPQRFDMTSFNITNDSKIDKLSNTHLSQTHLDKVSTNPIIISYQNVNIANQQPEQTINQLTDLDVTSGLNLNVTSHSEPDIIALVEAGGSNWQRPLNKLSEHYPTHCGVDKNSPFALQVFSKDYTARCDIKMLSGFPVAKLTFSPESSAHYKAQFRVLYVAHPPPPIGAAFAVSRNEYLNQLANLIKADQGQSVMVVGDFNLSAFSPVYRDFIDHSKAIDTSKGEYLNRTTLTGLPTWRPFSIGIDHVLVRPKNEGVNTHAIDWVGSDHRGFIIEWRE